ncbi:unnamed protein product [Aureobasidium vineae]|uniref:Uncharacterized protein n=1 Tax=Aureobasidium vineae TaxID=2773715 RepID=A0A9N8JJ82_9PEZI|nr:unnamed protein product [Aureobasidium vineae]
MYHDYMAKNLADRYANLNSQLDNVIKDANSEISALRDRLESSPSLSSSMPNYGLRAPALGQRQATPNRQPLGEIHRNATSSQGFGGYSASGGGVKIGGNMAQQRPQIINRNLSRVLNRG